MYHFEMISGWGCSNRVAEKWTAECLLQYVSYRSRIVNELTVQWIRECIFAFFTIFSVV